MRVEKMADPLVVVDNVSTPSTCFYASEVARDDTDESNRLEGYFEMLLRCSISFVTSPACTSRGDTSLYA